MKMHNLAIYDVMTGVVVLAVQVEPHQVEQYAAGYKAQGYGVVETGELVAPGSSKIVGGAVLVNEAFVPTPDYIKARRAEYPPIADQIDTLWKGGAEMEQMRQRIMAVKAKHPKPVKGA